MMTYGYLIESRGPEDLWGVALHHIRSSDNLTGYCTPHLGWWLSANDFWKNHPGFGAETMSAIKARYPDLVICPTRDEAIRRAGFDPNLNIYTGKPVRFAQG